MSGSKLRPNRTIARSIATFAPLALALLINAAPAQPSIGVSTNASTDQPQGKPGFAQTCAEPHFPIATPSPLDGTACGPAGNGAAETWQNEAKNNFCAADPGNPITIQEMIDLQAKVQLDAEITFGNPRTHPLTSKPGPATDRAPLVTLGEGKQVILQGFVRIARQEGPESVNCGKDVPGGAAFHDIHISIVQNSTQDECSGVVVEMIPHHRPDGWTAASVQSVANAQLPVRVTGQLMFDSSHSPCTDGNAIHGDPARASLWEIHPVYKFEVCPQGDCNSGTGWEPLEVWKKQ